MTTLRVYSFLGEAAAPHFSAVAELVARAAGCEPAPLEEPGLAQLDEIMATPGPALVFLCGLPYVRLRDDNAPIEADRGGGAARRAGARSTSPISSCGSGLEAGIGRRPRRPPHRVQRARLALGVRAAIRIVTGARAGRAALRRCDRDRQPPQLAGAARRGRDRCRRHRLDAAGARGPRRTRPSPALRVLERLGPAPIPPVVLLNGDAALAPAACATPSSRSTSTCSGAVRSSSGWSSASSRSPTGTTTPCGRWTGSGR